MLRFNGLCRTVFQSRGTHMGSHLQHGISKFSDLLLGFWTPGDFGPFESSKRGLLVQPEPQDARIWQSLTCSGN